MSHLTLASSITSFSSCANWSTLAYDGKAEPSPHSLPYVLGEQLAKLPLVKLVGSVASALLERLPSFSLPSAAAYDLADCRAPTGSYEESCQRPRITYLPKKEQCELTTLCATIYEGLPHRKASILFSPQDADVVLENHNGTLVLQRSRIERINDQLSLAAITPEALIKEQEALVGALHAGDVISLDSDGHLLVVSPETWEKESDGFSAFQRIAKATGGIMGYSPSAQNLNSLLEKMTAHILTSAESHEQIDIAFILDTTASMTPYINVVQDNLVRFLQHLQEKKKAHASTCRVALVEYRDQDEDFLNKVNMDFTSDLDKIQTAVKGLTTLGGGDIPEAALDALLAAKNNLYWHSEAKRTAIIISDAPFHPHTTDERYDEKAVVTAYQTDGIDISVYPVFAGKK